MRDKDPPVFHNHLYSSVFYTVILFLSLQDFLLFLSSPHINPHCNVGRIDFFTSSRIFKQIGITQDYCRYVNGHQLEFQEKLCGIEHYSFKELRGHPMFSLSINLNFLALLLFERNEKS